MKKSEKKNIVIKELERRKKEDKSFTLRSWLSWASLDPHAIFSLISFLTSVTCSYTEQYSTNPAITPPQSFYMTLSGALLTFLFRSTGYTQDYHKRLA